MSATDPYRKEARATVARLEEEIAKLRQKAELQTGMAQGAGREALGDLERRLEDLRGALGELESAPQERHEGLKAKIDAYTGDLDASIREAWTYYK